MTPRWCADSWAVAGLSWRRRARRSDPVLGPSGWMMWRVQAENQSLQSVATEGSGFTTVVTTRTLVSSVKVGFW